MRVHTSIFILLLTLLPVAFSQEAVPAEKAVDPNSFEAKVDALQEANKATMNRAMVSYLSRLDSLRQTMIQRGNLDNVLAVKAEEERFGKAQSVKPGDVVAKPTELNALMKAFVQGMQSHQKNQSAKFKALIEQERLSLQQQIATLTKANKIDEAIAVKNKLASFDANLRKIYTAAVAAKTQPVRTEEAATANPAPRTDGLRVDEEGRVDLTMGRGAFAEKAPAENGARPGERFRKRFEDRKKPVRPFFDR